MRAVRCVDGRATAVEVAAPEGEGVPVKVVSSGVCGSDLHMLELGFFDPFTIGHEFAGYTGDGQAVSPRRRHRGLRHRRQPRRRRHQSGPRALAPTDLIAAVRDALRYRIDTIRSWQ